MRRNVKSIYTISCIIGIAVSYLLLNACKKDNSISNYIEFLNKKYETNNGYFAQDNDDFYIWLSDGDLNADTSNSEEVYQTYVYMLLISGDNELAEGTYTFDDSEEAFTMYEGEVNFYGESGAYWEVTDGAVEVTKSGSNYTLTYDFTLGNSSAASGKYSGPITEIEF